MQKQSIRKKYLSQMPTKTQVETNEKPKLIKKTQLTKTTILNPNRLNNMNMNQNIIVRESTNEGLNNNIKNQAKNINSKQKDNKAEFLLKTILKAFYLSIWKRKVSAMKYFSRAYNPRRINFKKLITQISLALKQHKFDYFNEICANMDSLPMPKNIKHDINYGTIRIINREVLNKKNTNKMKISEENKNENEINDNKSDLSESNKKIEEEKKEF